MRLLSSGMIAVVAAALLAGGSAAVAQDAPAVAPARGTEVVIYTHRFKAEDFEEGLRLVTEGFTTAQAELGKSRLNYFIANPTTYDVVVVSFFGEDASVDEWHKSMSRLDVLDKLEPLRREPLELERFTVDAVTTVP